MKKSFYFLSLLLLIISLPLSAKAESALGIGPVGNIFVVDSSPELDPGIGGQFYFDYRWSPQFSTQIGAMVTVQDGKGNNAGDNDIMLLGIPTFDLKFYLLSSPSRWDPYGFIGMGLYTLTEGSADNGTVAFGVGANLGLGCDYYISERFSVGLALVFRSIGLIDDVGGKNKGKALFPLSLTGGVAYHF
ncbi:MAG: outer membrane beta-barrel protein [Pseudomonadota bacterium]